MPDHAGSALVVEDEPIIRELVAEVLADEGYAVRQAGDGAEALAAAERDRPDLVVSGVRMPRLDGLRLAERLGELRIPVVLVSATLERAPGPGVGFVAKPFALETLLAAVARAMGGR